MSSIVPQLAPPAHLFHSPPPHSLSTSINGSAFTPLGQGSSPTLPSSHSPSSLQSTVSTSSSSSVHPLSSSSSPSSSSSLSSVSFFSPPPPASLAPPLPHLPNPFSAAQPHSSLTLSPLAVPPLPQAPSSALPVPPLPSTSSTPSVSSSPTFNSSASPHSPDTGKTKTATVIPINDSTVSAAAMLMSIAATTSATASSNADSTAASASMSVPVQSSSSAPASSSSPVASFSKSALISSLSNPVPKPKPLPPVSALERFVHYLHPLLQSHPHSIAPSITLPQLRVIAQTNFHQLIALSLSVQFNPRRPYAGHTGKEEKLVICKNGWNALRNFVSAEREKVWRAEMAGLSVREQRAYKKRRKEEKKVANAAIREGRMAKFIDIANEYQINYAAFVKLGDEHSGRLRFRQIKKEQKDAAANALVNSSALISASNVNAAISSALPSPRSAPSYTLAHVVDEKAVKKINLDGAPAPPAPPAAAAAALLGEPSASSSSSSSSSAPFIPPLPIGNIPPPFPTLTSSASDGLGTPPAPYLHPALGGVGTEYKDDVSVKRERSREFSDDSSSAKKPRLDSAFPDPMMPWNPFFQPVNGVDEANIGAAASGAAHSAAGF